MKKRVLLLSYFAGQQGFSPAEWLDDKVDALVKLKHEVILISCLSSAKNTQDKVKHYRIPSISLNDFLIEFNELKKTNQKIPLWIFIFFPIAYIFGWLFDKIFIMIANGLGGGRLSWSISSLISSIYILIFNKIDVIVSTGGAASSHISGSIAGIIFRVPVVIELQDPLVGHGIGRSIKSAQMLHILESFLIKTSKRVVYVTQQAAAEARARWGKENAVCIYPAARKYDISAHFENKTKYRFLHLGTLYSSRNFNTLIKAFDLLIAQKKISADEFELINLGDIYGEYLNDYKKRNYFKQYPIRPRKDAINYASQSDVNIIVQHSDPRSTTTIPYKTYDYFNLDCQILGLTNNKELRDMLISNGYVAANITDVNEIADIVYKLIRKEIKFIVPEQKLNIQTQVEKLIEI